MLQALPNSEISVCDDKSYTRSSSSSGTSVHSNNYIGYIYTFDVNNNETLEQKTKKCPFFPETQNVLLNSVQTINMTIKRKHKNQTRS